jgi:hypothetical protein
LPLIAGEVLASPLRSALLYFLTSMASPSGCWAVAFAPNKDWDEGKISYGFLVFWSFFKMILRFL